MPRFIVTFLKDVLGEAGRTYEVCQSTIELDATNERAAAMIAKDQFSEMHRTHDWSLHADRLRVAPADFPS